MARVRREAENTVTFIEDPAIQEWVLTSLLVTISLLFFLACAFAVSAVLVRIVNIVKSLRWRKWERLWTVEILEILEGAAGAGRLMRLVRGRARLYFVDFLLRYSLRLKGPEKGIVCDIAMPYLPQVASRLRLRGETRRARAIQALGELGCGRYNGVIAGFLDDPSDFVALTAARELARSGDVGQAPSVLARLDRCGTWDPGFASSMIASMGSAALPMMRAAFLDEENPPSVRVILADALGRLHDIQAGDAAASVVTGADDPELVEAALKLLMKVGRAEHVPAVRILCRSADKNIRAAAVGVVARLGSDFDAACMRETLDDPDFQVAIEAARGLKDTGKGDLLEAVAASDHPKAELARELLEEHLA